MESALDQKDGVGRIAIQLRIGISGHRSLDDPSAIVRIRFPTRPGMKPLGTTTSGRSPR